MVEDTEKGVSEDDRSSGDEVEEEEIVYDTEDFISKAYLSPTCSMREDFFTLQYPFEPF